MSGRVYRQIRHTNRDECWIRVMALEELGKRLECPVRAENWYFNLNSLEWSIVVRVWTDDPLPFKELLDKSSKELYDFLREANERWLNERRK